METKARLKDVTFSINKKMLLTFEVDITQPELLEPFNDKDIRLKAVLWREKRSLDANRYYWELIGQLADMLMISTTELHNLMLAEYGQFEIIDNKLVNIILLDEIEWMKLEYHLKPTTATKVLDDGKIYRVYRVMRGSHTYDSKEMSTLIEGLVRACREQGIETLTEPERMRMYEDYSKRHDQ